MKLMFTKPNYNLYFREYFLPRLRFSDTPVVVLDGSLRIDQLVMFALSAIEKT